MDGALDFLPVEVVEEDGRVVHLLPRRVPPHDLTVECARWGGERRGAAGRGGERGGGELSAPVGLRLPGW